MAADPSATNLIDQQTLIPQRNAPQEPIEMGQVMQKLTAKNVDPKKQQEELKRLITAYLDKNYDRFADEMKKYSNVQENDPKLQNLFYHFVYETVEGINAACGAMQYKLPNFEEFKKIFELEHKDKTKELTKQEFQKIILKLVGFDNLYFGQGFKDIVMYTIGFPTMAVFVKRLILGPNSSLSDEIFIPVATSATIVYLAKSNKL